jgi:hypothetical protein
MSIKVHTRRDTLTDKSEAFDVVLRQGAGEFVIPMLSETNAEKLQRQLVQTFLLSGVEAESGDELRADAGWPVSSY